jgi:natural product precursor
MKNLKLNKLANNRLSEKEMLSLKGGTWTDWEYHFACNKDNVTQCCGEVCECTYRPPLLNPVSSNGASSAGATMKSQWFA